MGTNKGHSMIIIIILPCIPDAYPLIQPAKGVNHHTMWLQISHCISLANIAVHTQSPHQLHTAVLYIAVPITHKLYLQNPKTWLKPSTRCFRPMSGGTACSVIIISSIAECCDWAAACMARETLCYSISCIYCNKALFPGSQARQDNQKKQKHVTHVLLRSSSPPLCVRIQPYTTA